LAGGFAAITITVTQEGGHSISLQSCCSRPRREPRQMTCAVGGVAKSRSKSSDDDDIVAASHGALGLTSARNSRRTIRRRRRRRGRPCHPSRRPSSLSAPGVVAMPPPQHHRPRCHLTRRVCSCFGYRRAGILPASSTPDDDDDGERCTTGGGGAVRRKAPTNSNRTQRRRQRRRRGLRR
jgi:hypothetical protein